MTTPPSFPSLAGQGWSVHKKPTFNTIVASATSGREVRDSLWQYPLWEFELVFDGLDLDRLELSRPRRAIAAKPDGAVPAMPGGHSARSSTPIRPTMR